MISPTENYVVICDDNVEETYTNEQPARIKAEQLVAGGARFACVAQILIRVERSFTVTDTRKTEFRPGRI